VLEIGTGSGYQAAILSVLAREVISLERRPDLSKAAAERLSSHGFANVRVVTADGTRGLEDQAPFDRIIVTAGAPHVPATLKAQLADGARLVIPVGSEGQQRLLVITRHGDEFEQAAFEPCVFVPLIGEHGWPER
jgi:protein-L-isoaspartate(D-aspartate) O-methyltransferase